MTIQIIQLDDLSTPKKLNAHAAPVLSISLDPLMKYFASSGCDGTVNVWSLNSEAPSVAKSWENVFPKSNDISLTLSLCRMQWSPQGAKFLAIPEDNKIVLYSRGNWTRIQAFQCKDLTDVFLFSVQNINIMRVSWIDFLFLFCFREYLSLSIQTVANSLQQAFQMG